MKTQQIIQECQAEVSGRRIEERAAAMAEEFARRLGQQGISIESYYRAKNTTKEELLQKMRYRAEEQIKKLDLLEKIARQEGLGATQEETEQELMRLCLRYPVSLEEMKQVMKGKEMESLKRDITRSKAARFLEQNCQCRNGEKLK